MNAQAKIRRAMDGAQLVDGRIPEAPTPERVAHAGDVETVVAKYALDDGQGGILEAESAALRIPDDSVVGRIYRRKHITQVQYAAAVWLYNMHYVSSVMPFKRVSGPVHGVRASMGGWGLLDSERAVRASHAVYVAIQAVHPNDREAVRRVVIDDQAPSRLGATWFPGIRQSGQIQRVYVMLRRGLSAIAEQASYLKDDA